MKKFVKIILGLLIISLLLVGCDIPNEREIDKDAVLEPTYNEDMEEIHEIVRTKDLGDFTLMTKYNTIDYDLNKWKIIDNKTIKMSVWTEGLPEDWEAIIEHVHIDMFITNKYKDYPAILQDSMDDKYHGIKQDGFVINDNIAYENIFGIQGVSHKLSETYYKDVSIKKFEEDDFYRYDYTMNTMQIIYDIMIKRPGNDFYETVAVYDEIIIPVGNTIK